MRRHLFSIFALFVMICLAFGSSDSGTNKPTTPKSAVDLRVERIEHGFSAWDGSHLRLTEVIKDSMNDPNSYEHAETKYVDAGEYLIVITKFRGTNAFGGVVPNIVSAKVDLDGNVLQIVPESDLLAELAKAHKTADDEPIRPSAPPNIQQHSYKNESTSFRAPGESSQIPVNESIELPDTNGMQLNAESNEDTSSADTGFRMWTSAKGRFSISAKIRSYSNGFVTLEDATGKRLRVEKTKLSEEDQKFIQNWRSDR